MKTLIAITFGLLALNATCQAIENSPDVVHQRMQQLVPYAVDQTLETFSKSVHGGTQHIVVKSESNATQIKLLQTHLQKMVEKFRKGDFSITERLHGADMPGLAQLKTAKPYDIKFEYTALNNGGQIHYSSEYPLLVGALHEWFDAQSRGHGNTSIPGHSQHHSTPVE